MEQCRCCPGEDTFIPPVGCDVLAQTLADLEDEVENEDMGEDSEDMSEVSRRCALKRMQRIS